MPASLYAENARLKKSAEADALGINDALISQLVETFYVGVRRDPDLGPMFAAKIVDWPPHLQRMKDFWASIVMESGRFHGNPMLKHLAIPGLSPAHFQIWLILWDTALAEVVVNPDAASLFRDRAQRIADSLQIAIALHNGGPKKDSWAALNKEKNHAD